MNIPFFLLNIPAMLSVTLITLVTVFFVKTKQGKTSYAEAGDISFTITIGGGSIILTYVLNNLAYASAMGPWLAFAITSIFWASLMKLCLKYFALKECP